MHLQHQHHTCACEAMPAGANVRCEKPTSVTLDQAVQMAKCPKETGKILTIGFQLRYGENMKMISSWCTPVSCAIS